MLLLIGIVIGSICCIIACVFYNASLCISVIAGVHLYLYEMLSYRREIALQRGLVMAKNGRLELEDNIYGHFRSIFA